MGACKYIQELWRKKQSDVMRFLLRRAAGSTASSRCCTAPRAPPGPTRRAGWATRPSKAMSYTRSVCAAGAANAPFLRVPPTASLSTMVSTSSFARSLQSVTEECTGRHCGALRVLIPTGLVKILHTDSLRLSSLIHSIKLSEETLTPSGSPNQSTSTRRGGS